MVEVNTGWNEENLREYSEFNIFRKTKRTKILIFVLGAIDVLALAGGIVIFIITGFFQGFLLAGLLILFSVIWIFLMRAAINDFVKNSLKDNEDAVYESVMIEPSYITVCRQGKPEGRMSWDKINGIYYNGKADAFYLTAEENVLLILEKKNIVKGDMEELKKIACDKQKELPKAAGGNNKKS